MKSASIEMPHAMMRVLPVSILFIATVTTAAEPVRDVPKPIAGFVAQHCLDCHDGATKEGGLDLSSLRLDGRDDVSFGRWVEVYDRVRAGEMPPDGGLPPNVRGPFVSELAAVLGEIDRRRIEERGRTVVRRLNRYEYEETLRELLESPGLLVAERLPADGTIHGFSKSSAALDVSHVQMTKYLELARGALRTAVDAAAHPSRRMRHYARRENILMRYLKAPPVRATVPLIGWDVQKEVVLGNDPPTAWGDPDLQEREALAIFVGSRTDATRADFEKIAPPTSGRYVVRVKSYSVAAGANGFAGGKGFEETGRRELYFPDKRDIRRSERPEPVTLYAMKDSGDSRWLAAFDATTEPAVFETEVVLEKGDHIRADPSRLVRFEADWAGNPNQQGDTIPGWAVQWIEIEGPLRDEWPPASYSALFDELPFEVRDGSVRVMPENAEAEVRPLLRRFAERAYRGRRVPDEELDQYVSIYTAAREAGYDFTDATIEAAAAILVSPRFLYLGRLTNEPDRTLLASRLSYFLWNGPPDEELLAADLGDPAVLHRQTERLLLDPRSERFVERFLDEWLELREINSTVPDEQIYPEYSTDTLLVESAVRETQRFFGELLTENLPARNLIDSDFVFVNERLADHYGLPSEPTIELQRRTLPEGSPRGGLLGQAAVLKVTANGTTTSPVLRGKWVTERILGREIAPPPSGVDAIEPDTRGAVTIREQLAKHTETASCAACHGKFDPVGFALESFDVLGGWRDRYRGTGDVGEPVSGFGKEGRVIEYRLAQPVDSRGELDGEPFDDVVGLKALLRSDERAVARNLVRQLVIYATGEPVSFSERTTVEEILDELQGSEYGVRDLVHALIQSDLFRTD